MRKFIFFIFIILGYNAVSQNILSDQAQLSVITCGPYQGELYSAFGHSAFRVFDPAQGIDYAYNYGVFDFNQPNFYLNFAKGHLNYQLGINDYQEFKNYYIYHNRYIHEQVLNLTSEQKQKLFDYLQWNALPENEHYFYDYFYNNCSTKIRDLIKKVFGDEVNFDGSYIKTSYTIRDLTDIYLKRQPWGDLGIDIGLGLPMDKKATPYEHMFLPDYVESGLAHATIKQNNVNVPIVKETIQVYESRVEELPKGLPNPLYVFSVIALLAITLSVYDLIRKKLSNWFDVALFGASGLLGIFLVLLWFATDHKAAANNLNILWAIPMHLFAVMAFPKNPKWIIRHFLATAIISALLLICWPILPQKLHYALIPITLALGVRAFVQYFLRNAFRKQTIKVNYI